MLIGQDDMYEICSEGLTYSNCNKGGVCGGEDDIYGICSEGLTYSNCIKGEVCGGNC